VQVSWCWQDPFDESHESKVHAIPSSQDIRSCTQPVSGLQLSMVHGSKSLQFLISQDIRERDGSQTWHRLSGFGWPLE
jgi:hypothetical protein